MPTHRGTALQAIMVTVEISCLAIVQIADTVILILEPTQEIVSNQVTTLAKEGILVRQIPTATTLILHQEIPIQEILTVHLAEVTIVSLHLAGAITATPHLAEVIATLHLAEVTHHQVEVAVIHHQAEAQVEAADQEEAVEISRI